MDKILLAYLAGTIDSDGYFTIKKSTYNIRVTKDSHNPTFSEKMGLKQVRPTIPSLLRDTFGGSLRIEKPQTENSRSLHAFEVTNRKAARACRMLLPYLRLKKEQASTLLELRESKELKYRRVLFWFEKAYPDWQQLELITTTETARLLGYSSKRNVSLAVHNGTILSLPYDYSGIEKPRIPRLLIEYILEHRIGKKKHSIMPKELITWRQSLYDKVRELNKMGVNGTPVYHRTGAFAQVG